MRAQERYNSLSKTALKHNTVMESQERIGVTNRAKKPAFKANLTKSLNSYPSSDEDMFEQTE